MHVCEVRWGLTLCPKQGLIWAVACIWVKGTISPSQEFSAYVAYFKAYKQEMGSGTHLIVCQEPLGCGITSKCYK